MVISKERYLGLVSDGLVPVAAGSPLLAQKGAIDALHALQEDAKKQGFMIEACSAFRSFETQGRIVTAKFLGARAILDINEKPIGPIPAAPVERLKAILLFSALPGASRHHFGSDFDIYAPNKLPEGQKLQLTYHEYEQGSYFYELGLYLQESLTSFGFARPYMPQASKSSQTSQAAHASSTSTNGISVGLEPWHISHVESARDYLKSYDCEVALEYLEHSDLVFAPYVRQVWTQERIEALLRPQCC